MAADAQEPKSSRQPSVTSNPSASTEKSYDTFNYPATPENVNSLPGANSRQAHIQSTSAGFFDALKTIKLKDFKEVHSKPCTREGFLTGIGAGFGIGGIRVILGGTRQGLEDKPFMY